MIGVVAVARHSMTKKIVVLKCMSVEKIIEKNLMLNIKSEIDIHYELSSEPHILPLSKTLVRENEIVMVTPYIPGRDLYKFMMARRPRHLTEYQSHLVFRQLLAAIKSCHVRNIIHRDIKPENIMIDPEFRIFLSDFGLAVKLAGPTH
jgi:serine/threonine protein kinase